MRPSRHAILSVGVSAAFMCITKSWPGTIACFLSGIFIDIDHIMDYFFHYKKIPIRYQQLWDFCAYEKNGRLYLIFHSYEFLALFWYIVIVYDLSLMWYGLGIGLIMHILADEIANPMTPLAYFFVYRLKYGFKKEHLFKAHIHKKLRP